MAFSFSSFEEKLQASKNHTYSEIKKLRTGRASASILDDVSVEAYGTCMRITEVASIAVPDATLLLITPWDKSLIESIEKAIQAADLNLNPVVDGGVIRIAVPPLTEENRQDLVKKLHQNIESGRVAIRSIRSETKRQIEEQKGNSGVSEDDIAASIKELEEKVREAFVELEQVLQKKEQELLTI